jgi:hypothetical protein
VPFSFATREALRTASSEGGVGRGEHQHRVALLVQNAVVGRSEGEGGVRPTRLEERRAAGIREHGFDSLIRPQLLGELRDVLPGDLPHLELVTSLGHDVPRDGVPQLRDAELDQITQGPRADGLLRGDRRGRDRVEQVVRKFVVVVRELALIVDAAENLELRGRGRLRRLAGGVTAGRASGVPDLRELASGDAHGARGARARAADHARREARREDHRGGHDAGDDRASMRANAVGNGP